MKSILSFSGYLLTVFSFLALVLVGTVTADDIEKRVEHGYADSGGVKIHYAALGDKKNPLVVMIHGFPDFWYSWRDQMDALSKDYYAVAQAFHHRTEHRRELEDGALGRRYDDWPVPLAPSQGGQPERTLQSGVGRQIETMRRSTHACLVEQLAVIAKIEARAVEVREPRRWWRRTVDKYGCRRLPHIGSGGHDR